MPRRVSVQQRGSPNSGLPLVKLILSAVLEFLLQLDVPEPADVVVFESGIAVGVAMEEPGLSRRILAEDIVAADGDRAVVEDRLPARHGVGRSAFNHFAVLARDTFLATLRV